MAGWFTALALVGWTPRDVPTVPERESRGAGPDAKKGVQASGKFSRAGPKRETENALATAARSVEQQLAQPVGAGAAVHHQGGGMQCPAGEDLAVAGDVAELERFAGAGEGQPVDAHNLALAQRFDGGRAPVHGLRRARQRQRRARGGIELVDVVGLHQRQRPVRQRRRGALQQILQHGYAEAEIGGDQGGDASRRLLQACLLGRREPGGAADQGGIAVHAQRQDPIEAVRQAEIDGKVEVRRRLQVRRGQAGRALQGFAGTRSGSHHGKSIVFECQSQHGPTHAPAGAMHQQPNRGGTGHWARRPEGIRTASCPRTTSRRRGSSRTAASGARPPRLRRSLRNP